MQDDKDKEKKVDEAGDEIISILDNYRKKQKEETSAVKPPMNPTIKQVNQPIGKSNNPEEISPKIDEAPQASATHFVSNTKDSINEPMREPINPHLSDSVNKDALKNAQRMGKNERFQKEKKPAKKFFLALGNGSFLFKALFYIFFVLIISAYLSYYVITIGNDVFALVKTSSDVTVFVREGATTDEIASTLEEKGIIEYEWVFKLYMKYRSDEEYTFIAGDHVLSAKMNYTNIIDELTVEDVAKGQVRIVIPEGLTVDEIIDLFLQNGIGSREDFVEAINNYSYDWDFVKALDALGYPDSRKYRLEGYLYPDTYDFYLDTDEVWVINKLLANFDAKFWQPYYPDNEEEYASSYKAICDSYGMSFDDLITLASMVEAEGNNAEDFYYISQVFHNRLESESLKKLQSDATTLFTKIYIRGITEDRELTQVDLDYNSLYNTYYCEGLPCGAICNPGTDAIAAALDPMEPGDGLSYYFVSNDVGKTYYARSESVHEQNKKKVELDNAAIEAGTYVG